RVPCLGVLWSCTVCVRLVLRLCMYGVFFFFFSSRRRHTRCYRDWSSDVCSSDLRLPHDGTGLGLALVRQTIEAHNGSITVAETRSEERRVGKEGRDRWGGWQ